MAKEIVERSFKPGRWNKPQDWRLEGGWLYRDDKAVVHLPDVTKGSWFAGQKPREFPYHQLILSSSEDWVRVRAHGGDDSPDTRQMRRLAIKTLDQIRTEAPEAKFRIGPHPLEMATYFLVGIVVTVTAVAILFSGERGSIFGLALLPPGVYTVWKWPPWSARHNATAAEVVAEILKKDNP